MEPSPHAFIKITSSIFKFLATMSRLAPDDTLCSLIRRMSGLRMKERVIQLDELGDQEPMTYILDVVDCL